MDEARARRHLAARLQADGRRRGQAEGRGPGAGPGAAAAREPQPPPAARRGAARRRHDRPSPRRAALRASRRRRAAPPAPSAPRRASERAGGLTRSGGAEQGPARTTIHAKGPPKCRPRCAVQRDAVRRTPSRFRTRSCSRCASALRRRSRPSPARWSPTRATSPSSTPARAASGRMLKKAMTGEGTTLMKMTGTGEVFLADQAQDVHLIYLENDFITVNGPNLLAFDAGIDWDIKRISGGARRDGRRPVQPRAARHRLGRDPLRRPARAAQRRVGADVRRRAGRDHLVVGRHDVDQDRLQDEEPDRPRLRRDDPDGVRRPGLGARAAVRGPGRRSRHERARAAGSATCWRQASGMLPAALTRPCRGDSRCG